MVLRLFCVAAFLSYYEYATFSFISGFAGIHAETFAKASPDRVDSEQRVTSERGAVKHLRQKR